ncbi:hypothetical protein [Klebsiella quasipneumoniae]|uniref:hypothetical protein n=1 Tax=Klebsiella quasipneumoniae TaxID=1463165 RepID=UPI0011B5FAB9|nr:hypothetical protein [Klebsiella quasipneumoniae]TWV32296.1 hypothetical protein FRA07_00655 [Klebsiella quasipneumoniae subsp. similipneumoniae]HBY9388004.1 hypothetical protein [Klebsiella pneumoniae]
MRNAGYTRIPDLLIQTMKTADAAQAKRLFDDAELCADRMAALLVCMAKTPEQAADTADTSPDEMRDVGASLALTVEITRGMYDVVDVYRLRQIVKELHSFGEGRNV